MMLQLELLPRLVPDAHFDRLDAALAEADERVSDPSVPDAMTRVAKGRYGGFYVFTVSRRFAMDFLLGQAEYDLVDPGQISKVFRR